LLGVYIIKQVRSYSWFTRKTLFAL